MGTTTQEAGHNPAKTKILIRNIAYWVTTVLTAASFCSGGIIYLSGSPEVAAGMQQLGFPPYFPMILGPWKLLGGIVILLPRLALLKEWAYAGMLFNLTAASAANAFAGNAVWHIITPLVVLLLVAVSWALRPESKRLAGTSI